MSIERIDIEPKGPGGRALPSAKPVRAGVFVSGKSTVPGMHCCLNSQRS